MHTACKFGKLNKAGLLAAADIKGCKRSVAVNGVKVYTRAVDVVCGSSCEGNVIRAPHFARLNVCNAVNGDIGVACTRRIEYECRISVEILVKRKLNVGLYTARVEAVLAAADPKTVLCRGGLGGKNACGHGGKDVLG